MVPEYVQSASPAVRDLFRSLRRYRNGHRKTRIDEVRFLFAPGEGGPENMRVTFLRRGRDRMIRVINKKVNISLPNPFAVKGKEDQVKIQGLVPRVVYDALRLDKEEVLESNMKLVPRNYAMTVQIHRSL